ncbi:HtaA domain-containing protein [Leucobacter sp. NPDC015123]|uniref:HtaA domain-containing protein n=1 Tax=Leucobacter sp. NPDC015123 TaxID=3364129 RepID=UPI0036F4847B
MIRKFRTAFTAAVALTLAMGGAFATPLVAQAMPLPVEGGTLNWGVAPAWGSYVTGPIAQGEITAGAPASALGDGTVQWAEGSGDVDLKAGTGTVTFAGSMLSQGHSGHGVDGGFGLDQMLANPQITLSSPTAATLSAEVTQGAYAAFKAHAGERVVLADLSISEGDLADGHVVAAGVFAATSAPVFGNTGNFAVGKPTGEVSFTLPTPTEAVTTTTSLAVSESTVAAGETIDLAVTVVPASAVGAVVFSNHGVELSDGIVDVVNGAASLTGVSLPTGTNSISARFVPEDDAAFSGSQSQAVAVEVTSKALATSVSMSVTPASTVVEGNSVTMTAKVTPTEAAGTLQFTNGDAALGSSISVNAGTATLKLDSLEVGTYDLGARFTPDDAERWLPSAIEGSHRLVVTPKDTGESVRVDSGELTWNVKDTWWNYIYGPIADGEVRATLPATLVTDLKNPAGGKPLAVTWSDASSRKPVNLRTGVGTIEYKGEMRSLGHAGSNYPGGYGLHQRLIDPHIVLTSPTTAKLSASVVQTGYASFPAMSGQRVDIAELKFTAQSLRSGKVTTTAAVFTEAGARLYGNYGNHTTGSYMAPVSFSVNAAAVRPTTTTLTASARSVTVGDGVQLFAKIAPTGVSGTVSFYDGKTKLGQRAVTAGAASLAVPRLTGAGDKLFRAEFTPTNRDFAASVGSATVTVVAMPPAPPTSPGASQQAGSLVWGVSSAFASYTTGQIAKGSIHTSGVGSSGGAYVFPQATGGSWNAKAQTGTVQYSGQITFTGHGGLLKETFSNPTITVSSATSGSISAGGRTFGLDLAGAQKSVGEGGAATWTGVPVSGEICGGGSGGSGSGGGCFNADRLSFTVGAASKVSYGSTVAGKDAKEKRVAAATPPTTEGLTIVTDKDKLVPGARIEIQAAGFDPEDEGVLVVLYSDPIVLDEEATADKFGVVHWTGKLPDDIQPGAHVLTLQGSTDVGAKITILPKGAKAKKSAEELVEVTTQPLAAATGAGPVLGAGGSGMALWEWWVVALSLVAIAGCTTTLAVRQRAANR